MKKKFLAVVLLAALILLPAAAAAKAAPVDDAFVIENMHVTVDVDEYRAYSFREQLDVLFSQPRRGIIQDIWAPAQNDPFKVTDVRVRGDNFEVGRYASGGGIYIQIGDADTYISGEKSYDIGYRLRHHLDRESAYDYVYVTVVGTDWATAIENVQVQINFPAAATQFDLTSGEYGMETNAADIRIEQLSDTSYRLTGSLEAFEGITVLARFPEGTFNEYAVKNRMGMLTAGAVALAVALGMLLWCRSLNTTIVPVVEFYAPDNLNPAQVGTIIDGRTDNKDITALIIYWASHGHLIIEDRGGSFTLKKQSDLDEAHASHERIAFNDLWKLGKEGVVHESELDEHYYVTVQNTKNAVQAQYLSGPTRLIQKGSGFPSFLGLLLSCAMAFAALFEGVYAQTFSAAMASVMGVLAIMLILVVFAWAKAAAGKRHLKGSAAIGSVPLYIVSAAMALVLAVIALPSIELGFFLRLPLLLAAFLTAIFAGAIKRYSQYGAYILGRTVGFRNFLKYAEVERLEALLKDNPSYYYDTLPYAMVLDLTKVWADKFASLVTQPPTWYYSDMSTFNTLIFLSMLNRTTARMNHVMVSTPPPPPGTGGGGGFSGGGFGGGGGGFSGGGSGGGGGRSW